MERFKYETKSGKGGVCGLDVRESPDRRVVILTEVSDNPGMSVTNACEQIVTQLAASRGWLDPVTGKMDKSTVWVEHYSGSSYKPLDDTFEDTWDLVTFTQAGGEFTSPVWRRLSQEALTKLVAEFGPEVRRQ